MIKKYKVENTTVKINFHADLNTKEHFDFIKSIVDQVVYKGQYRPYIFRYIYTLKLLQYFTDFETENEDDSHLEIVHLLSIKTSFIKDIEDFLGELSSQLTYEIQESIEFNKEKVLRKALLGDITENSSDAINSAILSEKAEKTI